MPTPFKFTLGADPEFSIIFGNRKISAQSIIESIMRKEHMPTAELESQMGFATRQGMIGFDGHAVTAEIRPKPSSDPKELSSIIGGLITELYKKIPFFSLTVSNEYGPVGGHVHLSLSNEITKNSLNKNAATARIHRLMSYFCLPLFLGEDPTNSAIRRYKGMRYGELTDYRISKFDEHYTYEYRPLTAEWILTPKLCQATLAYMAVVYDQILRNKNLEQQTHGFANGAQIEAIGVLLDTKMDFVTDHLLHRIKKQMRTFAKYPEWKQDIEYILNYKRIRAEKQKHKMLIENGWGLVAKQPTNFRQISSQRTLKKLAATNDVDLDPLINSIYMPYNDDLHVASFISLLKQTLIVNRWQLNKSYMFFGLRKSIPDFIVAIATSDGGQELCDNKFIKNSADYVICRNTIDKIAQRFERSKKTIYVGIPYELRIKQLFLPFLKKIWELEHAETFQLLDPTKLPEGKSTTFDLDDITDKVNSHNFDCENDKQFAREVLQGIAAQAINANNNIGQSILEETPNQCAEL